MLKTLPQRNFALLWFAGLISMIGDWVLAIALPIYTYNLTHSTLATGSMFIAGTLPRIIFGSLAGVFVDRWSRKYTMVIADFARAAVVCLLLLVRSPEWMWLIYLVAFAESTLSMFFGPAENALLPELVDASHLVAANALNSLNNNLARLAGPALGGLLFGLLGFTSSAIIDSLSFIVSGLMIALIVAPAATLAKADRTSEPPTSHLTRIWQEWLSGLRLIDGNSVVKGVFIIMAVSSIGEGLFNIMFVIFIRQILNGGALEFGWLTSAQAVGGILGGLLIGRIGGKVDPGRLAVLLSVNGLLILVMTYLPSFPLAVFLLFLCGIPLIGFSVGIDTLLQQEVKGPFRGRVFGTLMTSMAIFVLLAQGTASSTGDALGSVSLLTIKGLLDITGGLLAIRLLVGTRKAASKAVLEPASEDS